MVTDNWNFGFKIFHIIAIHWTVIRTKVHQKVHTNRLNFEPISAKNQHNDVTNSGIFEILIVEKRNNTWRRRLAITS